MGLSRMDILFVRDLFRPIEFGGNRYPFEVTRRLAERHRVRVVTPRFGGPLPGPTAVEFRHYAVSRRTPFETFFTNALFSRLAVEAEFVRHEADVVVLSSYDVAFGYYALPRRRIPSAYVYHSSFYSPAVDRVATKPWPLRLAHPPLAAFLPYVERLTFRSAGAIVAVSPFSKAEIEARLGRPEPKVRVIPTGVDTAFFTPGDAAASRERLGLPARARVLLTVGRLAPVKRYDRAIDALGILRRDDASYLLLVAGWGPEEERLRAHARAAGLADAVRFVGFADGDRLRDLYRAADVVLNTSEFENWSLAILEGLACGTPVVATPRGSNPDLLGPVDPLLITAGVEPEAIAAAVRALGEPNRAARLAARGREHVVRMYGWDRTVAGLEGCLAALLRSGGTPERPTE